MSAIAFTSWRLRNESWCSAGVPPWKYNLSMLGMTRPAIPATMVPYGSLAQLPKCQVPRAPGPQLLFDTTINGFAQR